MSLDVYLILPTAQPKPHGSGIFIREAGSTREITRAEWNEKFPGTEPMTFHSGEEETNVAFTANITHNLNKMAGEAKIYDHLWRPEEIGITKARQLIEPLTAALASMKDDPARFEAFNPPNGWGSYAVFVPWIEEYLAACIQYPEATVNVSR